MNFPSLSAKASEEGLSFLVHRPAGKSVTSHPLLLGRYFVRLCRSKNDDFRYATASIGRKRDDVGRGPEGDARQAELF